VISTSTLQVELVEILPSFASLGAFLVVSARLYVLLTLFPTVLIDEKHVWYLCLFSVGIDACTMLLLCTILIDQYVGREAYSVPLTCRKEILNGFNSNMKFYQFYKRLVLVPLC
jgi:hypothetical protein